MSRATCLVTLFLRLSADNPSLLLSYLYARESPILHPRNRPSKLDTRDLRHIHSTSTGTADTSPTRATCRRTADACRATEAKAKGKQG
ncbi:hypothetical protein BKA62DRAFT_721880 [Auriculariales sp. MPI-PUGE-AT-0066]|nr:hypothetical protein BKA62DRAFT_721880 [Auriculariales sp. MPI-PUGE-AT-0066]